MHASYAVVEEVRFEEGIYSMCQYIGQQWTVAPLSWTTNPCYICIAIKNTIV